MESDQYDKFVDKLGSAEFTYDVVAKMLGISITTLTQWMREAKVQGLRPNAFRKRASLDRAGLSKLLREKQVPLDKVHIAQPQ